MVSVLSIYEVCKKVRRERGTAHLDLPLADRLMYATAQRHGAVLWTQDEDFDGVEGVKYFAKHRKWVSSTKEPDALMTPGAGDALDGRRIDDPCAHRD